MTLIDVNSKAGRVFRGISKKRLTFARLLLFVKVLVSNDESRKSGGGFD